MGTRTLDSGIKRLRTPSYYGHSKFENGRVGFLESGSLSTKLSMAVVSKLLRRWLEIFTSEFERAVLHVLKVHEINLACFWSAIFVFKLLRQL